MCFVADDRCRAASSRRANRHRYLRAERARRDCLVCASRMAKRRSGHFHKARRHHLDDDGGIPRQRSRLAAPVGLLWALLLDSPYLGDAIYVPWALNAAATQRGETSAEVEINRNSFWLKCPTPAPVNLQYPQAEHTVAAPRSPKACRSAVLDEASLCVTTTAVVALCGHTVRRRSAKKNVSCMDVNVHPTGDGHHSSDPERRTEAMHKYSGSS